MKLKNKIVVITGASKGLGRSLAARCAREGSRLALCARSLDALRETGIDVESTGCECMIQSCDLADVQQAEEFAHAVLARYGSVDVVINNAAVLGSRVELVDYPPSEWKHVLDVNISGAFFLTRILLRSMIKQRSGSIVNVSSSVGKVGRPRWGAYAVSKFALEGFTHVLAEEVRSFGIRANIVNPGAIATAMRRAAYPQEDLSKHPSPDQVTDVFVYLASDESRGVTGRSFDAQKFRETGKEYI